MKKTKEEIMNETEKMLVDDAAIIRVYEKILSGQLKRFPLYTWELPNSLYYARVLTKYLFEVKLQWSINDIKKNVSFGVIKQHKLYGMYSALFKTNFDCINNAYPNEIYPWELEKAPNGFWKCDKNKRAALHWLFEEKLGGDLQDIKNILSQQTFAQYDLFGLLNCFHGSPYQALEFMYPGKVKPWELEVTPKHYWNCDNNKQEALQWLFEEIFEGDLTKIKQNLSKNTFKQYGLGGRNSYSKSIKIYNFL